MRLDVNSWSDLVNWNKQYDAIRYNGATYKVVTNDNDLVTVNRDTQGCNPVWLFIRAVTDWFHHRVYQGYSTSVATRIERVLKSIWQVTQGEEKQLEFVSHLKIDELPVDSIIAQYESVENTNSANTNIKPLCEKIKSLRGNKIGDIDLDFLLKIKEEIKSHLLPIKNASIQKLKNELEARCEVERSPTDWVFCCIILPLVCIVMYLLVDFWAGLCAAYTFDRLRGSFLPA